MFDDTVGDSVVELVRTQCAYIRIQFVDHGERLIRMVPLHVISEIFVVVGTTTIAAFECLQYAKHEWLAGKLNVFGCDFGEFVILLPVLVNGFGIG